MKKSGLTTFQSLFNSYTDVNNRTAINFDSSIGAGAAGDYLTMFNVTSATTTSIFQTNALFRDASAWYHIVVAVDTTQATSTERVKLWVNNTLQTFSTYNAPSQNADLSWNSATTHYYGVYGGSPSTTSLGFNGYLANVHFIDGQALDPSSFTETDATTGQLIPKTYTGSYGTNGFNLLFADNSSNTASTLGKDTSGLSNNWTPNNLSVTAGAGNDSLVDSPTNYGTDTGVGGEVRGNYCTFNPLKASTNAPSITNGNLDFAFGSGTATWKNIAATFGLTSGKWYWEVTATAVGGSGQLVGIASAAYNFNKDTVSGGEYVGVDANSWGYYSNDGKVYTSGSGSAYGNSYAIGDIIGVALDVDNGKVWFSKNGTYQNSGSPTGGTNAAATGLPSTGIFPAFSVHGTGGSTQVANFGQRAFAYTAPSGFKALCTQNLPAPLVTKSNTVMDVALYTGNGSTQTISGLGFSPDLVWLKVRSNAVGHGLFDQVRGAGKALYSHATNAEYDYGTTSSGELYQFNSDGFNLGSFGVWNVNNQTSVAWAWDAGTSTVSNTQGSITSQVRANATAGFSVVTYTGTGTAGATVGHGLGVAPGMIITKSRSNTSEWVVYHKGLATPASQRLELQSTAAVVSSASDWNYTNPSSTVVTLGTSYSGNFSGYTHVMYAFSPVVGYSSFGSYTGNGSTDGPFVYTGMRTRWVMIKCSSASGIYWVIMDAVRNSYNVVNGRLFPNTSDPEYTNNDAMDFLSNGFKFRTVDATWNGSGNTYIYAAFAEAPFNYSRAR
jgi:hypothetical protein